MAVTQLLRFTVWLCFQPWLRFLHSGKLGYTKQSVHPSTVRISSTLYSPDSSPEQASVVCLDVDNVCGQCTWTMCVDSVCGQ